jgi:hypothetical protein
MVNVNGSIDEPAQRNPIETEFSIFKHKEKLLWTKRL